MRWWDPMGESVVPLKGIIPSIASVINRFGA